jgi:copper oxidase (laccase) domain-containing protein
LLGQGDALLENAPGAVVAVRTADCIPILLVDARLRAVAAVHAGWRGTVAGIARNAVETMGARFGSLPADLHAAIGPGIG